MTSNHRVETDQPQSSPNREIQQESETETGLEISVEPKEEKILCPHCLRTATNGVKCQGICVADSNY